MTYPNHYDTLEINSAASQTEIKQAYRRLAKEFHPDRHQGAIGHEQIARINAAYEVLSDPQQRRTYDQQLALGARVYADVAGGDRQRRAAAAQRQYQQRQRGHDSDEQLQQWMSQVYRPVNRMLTQILNPLQSELDDLSADPFDDELLDDFHAYLDDCRDYLQNAQRSFRSMPNPPNVAGVAAHLYYCLNQVGDGIDELERFTSSYDEHYLHTGQELFRIARGLRREAQAAIRTVV